MLATLVKEPFNQPGWVYEEKYDGYRILAYKEGDRVTLLSRNAKDRTAHFAARRRRGERLCQHETLLLDGEVVAFDRRGVSRFQLLQNLANKPHFAVFDCLYMDGRDLRAEPLRARRAALEKSSGKTRGKAAHSVRLRAPGSQRTESLRNRQTKRVRGRGRERRIRLATSKDGPPSGSSSR